MKLHGSSPDSAQRRGFTLVETVMSMVVLTIIVGGLSSAMVLMMRTANSDATSSSSVSTTSSGTTRSAMDQITDDLKMALTIPEQTSNAVTMTVPDRDSDGQPETIRYAWMGVSGTPITRQYNGGTAVSILDNVTQFNVQHLLRTIGPPPTPPPVESAEQLLASSDQILLVSSFGLKSSTKASQYFIPSFPANTISWKVTRIKAQITRNALATADAQFEIDLADSQNRPTGTALDSATVPITGIGLGQTSWVEFTCSNLSGLDPSAGLCIVAKSASTSTNYYVNYANLSLAGGSAFATYSSGSWGSPSTLKAMQYYVYGTVTTQP